ncbi:GAF domain-containing sensor histidine kinase [Marmoricola sp. URHB0036]|uniref:sensor histidine kinase n=1 Tax=Marmoricola sp. URHB0036 TaxID=1298863 RepID=UPI000411D164|nr:GAF domain-containing sensor histidine kinase [Marmoricola sp. URHB0036]
MEVEDGLAVVLSEFARTLVTDFPIKGILDHLVRRIVDILPVDAAGVSLITPTTHPRLIAGSDESAIRYEHLQTSLGEGPCLAAYETDRPISMPNLADDTRFPVFVRCALAEGLVAVFTFPLRNDDRCLGALDLYRRSAGALDAPDMATAQTLADVATAYLLNAEARMAKNEFVATVSHELRTPMTSIAGYVELLQDGKGGQLSSGQAAFVDAIGRNSDRLTALANDLLTVSGLEDPDSEHERVDLDLADVIDAARFVLQPLIAESRRTVTFETPADPVIVHGNPADLEAMVVNLMTNALKFTQNDGWVSCELLQVAGTARIEVRDNGLGIPREEQRDLFTRFFRSSTAQEHAIQGTGLGLTIVDSIVQHHGGDISVVSDHLEGSTFTVSLPLAQGSWASDR